MITQCGGLTPLVEGGIRIVVNQFDQLETDIPYVHCMISQAIGLRKCIRANILAEASSTEWRLGFLVPCLNTRSGLSLIR